MSTKAKLAELVSTRQDLSKKDALILVQEVFDSLIDILKEEGHFSFSGFGSFKVKTKAPRTARNPRTGDPIEVGEKKSLAFKVSAQLKQKLNEWVPPANSEESKEEAIPLPV